MNHTNEDTPIVQYLYKYSDDYLKEETFDQLLEGKKFRMERIVSGGQSTPDNKWYDQEDDEWVLLLKGEAHLKFKGDNNDKVLHPGDCIHIPAHCLHRVEQTSLSEATVWLAVHYIP
jgi:cupin 2 domain-containing protein